MLKEPFRPNVIDALMRTYAAGLKREFHPSARQLRDWMNDESQIPDKYHMALYDFIGKLNGRDLMRFTHNNGASIRGFVHLIHQVESRADHAVHFVDRYSDTGDQRKVFGKGYLFM